MERGFDEAHELGPSRYGARWRRRFFVVIALVILVPVLVIAYTVHAFRGRYGRHLCFARGALQIRLDRRGARVRLSILDLSGAAAGVRQSSAWRLPLARDRLRRRQGPAGRHVEAPLPGHRAHVPELRRVPYQHGAGRARSDAGLVLGMPANTFDIMAFRAFSSTCGKDPKFSKEYVIPEVRAVLQAQGDDLDLIDRYLVYPLAIWLMRERC